MAKVKDLILSDTGDDLKIKDGDFLIDFSDEQHVQEIINSYQGYYQQFPLVGVGVQSYLKSTGKVPELERKIRIHLESDNYRINFLRADDSDGEIKIEVDADRIL